MKASWTEGGAPIGSHAEAHVHIGDVDALGCSASSPAILSGCQSCPFWQEISGRLSSCRLMYGQRESSEGAQRQHMGQHQGG